MPETVILVQQPGDQAIEAIASFAQQRGGWQLQAFSDASLARDPSLLATAAGVLAHTKSPATRARLQASGLPWINLRDANPGGCLVGCDARAVGRLAGTHLFDLGVEGIAFLGDGPVGLLEGLRTACGRRFPVRELRLGSSFQAWLRNLEAPQGLLCPNDGLGVEAIRAIRSAGRRVPDDVAVCGVNNNPAQALFAAVPLTTVDLNLAGMATTAARLLHAHLTKGTAIPPLTLVPPGGLICRRSTDVRHQLDPILGAALRIMEVEFADGIRLERVLEACGCSRSTLERLFRDRFAITPGAWLRERRLREARRLLGERRLSHADIAERCGLANAAYLARAFRRRFGRPPSVWVRDAER